MRPTFRQHNFSEEGQDCTTLMEERNLDIKVTQMESKRRSLINRRGVLKWIDSDDVLKTDRVYSYREILDDIPCLDSRDSNLK